MDERRAGDVERRRSAARWWLAGLIVALAVGSIAYRLLVFGKLQQSAALFVGVPALLALVLALFARPASLTGLIMLGTTIALLMSGILLGEGFVCIVMASPIFYLVAALVAMTAGSLARRRAAGRPPGPGAYGLLLGVLPAIVLEQTGGSWQALVERPLWLSGLLLPLLAVPALLGLSAVQEFAERGGGTPLPFDPPTRLVTSGVYAYLANPMQLAGALCVVGWGLLLGSGWLAAGGLFGLAYGAGLAAWDEGGDLPRRHGAAWAAYRAAVRPWWPRWRPYQPSGEVARLYVARGCGPCAELGRWLAARGPLGLAIRPKSTRSAA